MASLSDLRISARLTIGFGALVALTILSARSASRSATEDIDRKITAV